MIMAMSNDIRVLLIKLADGRRHNLSTISVLENKKREELLEKHSKYMLLWRTRLGIHNLSTELENLSLRHIFR